MRTAPTLGDRGEPATPSLTGEEGRRRWRKYKGVAMVRLADGSIRRAEIHWYESHGIGRKEFKVKRLLPIGAP